jgi:hypothetical protein
MRRARVRNERRQHCLKQTSWGPWRERIQSGHHKFLLATRRFLNIQICLFLNLKKEVLGGTRMGHPSQEPFWLLQDQSRG